jgi:hypothetical protein
MATPPPTQLGNQTRTEMLPVSDKMSDFLGPNYSYADELPLPSQIGVRQGSSFGSVVDAAKGAMYYADMIGYGQPSNFMTRSMRQKPFPLGINYYLRTGSKCSNGADMWYYVNGIPAGTALGERIQRALRSMGLPQLRGLAPGIAEDAKAALDPTPILNALFGSGYAKCKEVLLPVGDFNGKTRSEDGKQWIQELYPGDFQRMTVDGQTRVGQKRWIFDSWMTQEQFQSAPKTHCPDGTLITAHQDNNCARPLRPAGSIREGWKNPGPETSVAVLGVLFALAAIAYRFSDD